MSDKEHDALVAYVRETVLDCIQRIRVSVDEYVEVCSRGSPESKRKAIMVLREMRGILVKIKEEFFNKEEEATPEKAEEEEATPEKKAEKDDTAAV